MKTDGSGSTKRTASVFEAEVPAETWVLNGVFQNPKSDSTAGNSARKSTAQPRGNAETTPVCLVRSIAGSSEAHDNPTRVPE